MTNIRASYEKYCYSLGVKPMPEVEWNAFTDTISHYVAGCHYAATVAAISSFQREPHDDRKINPKPQPQPQYIKCRPTRCIRKRNFHGHTLKRLADQRELDVK
jgi:hypothetical protein